MANVILKMKDGTVETIENACGFGSNGTSYIIDKIGVMSRFVRIADVQEVTTELQELVAAELTEALS